MDIKEPLMNNSQNKKLHLILTLGYFHKHKGHLKDLLKVYHLHLSPLAMVAFTETILLVLIVGVFLLVKVDPHWL